jgi:hypothetical protein
LYFFLYFFSEGVCTANKGLGRIQYKCLVPIYVFLEMKLLFPKQNFNALSPSSYTSVRDYIFPGLVCLFCCRKICGSWGNIEIAHRQMNVEIGTWAAQFPEKENINGIFVAVWAGLAVSLSRLMCRE